MRTWIGLLAITLPWLTAGQEKAAPEDKEASDFIRFLRSDNREHSDVLQTAIVRFERPRDGTVVDLVAVVHVADAGYYEKLNLLLRRYDAVLYELVGGEFDQRAAREAELAEDPEIAGLQGVHGLARQFLGLESQLESIDYEAKNFVHADADWDQFRELMEARNQSMGTLFSRAMSLSDSGELEGLPTTEQEANAMMMQLVASIAGGDSSGLKRTIAPILSEAETLITQLEGEDGTVLVSERNKIVMRKLDDRIAEADSPKPSFAIFYGAGHMPDLEERLRKAGFRKKNVTWATAWDLPHAKPGDKPAANRFFEDLLSEDSDLIDILGSFSRALNEAAGQPRREEKKKPSPDRAPGPATEPDPLQLDPGSTNRK